MSTIARSPSRRGCASRVPPRWRSRCAAGGVRAEEAARRGGDQGRGDADGRGAPRSGPPPAPARATSPTTGSPAFHDDQLTAAVAEAIAHNADLHVGGGARRAGAALREARRREALSVGRPARARRRQAVGRQLGHPGRRAHRDLGARPLGPRAIRPRGGRRRRRRPRRPTSSTRASRSPRWWPRAGSWRPRPGCRRSVARAHHSRTARSWCSLAETASRVGVGNDEDVYVARATSGPTATRCGRSSWRASRRSGRSSS